MYELDSLPACASCFVRIKDGPAILGTAPVSLGSAAAAVRRVDVATAHGTKPEYIEGAVVAYRKVRPRIVVRDAATHAVLADSLATGTTPCDAPQCDLGRASPTNRVLVIYRLGGLSPSRAVDVQLVTGPEVTDTRRMTTARAGDAANADTLVVPSAANSGRFVEGVIGPGVAYAPGAEDADVVHHDRLEFVQLRDAEHKVVAAVHPQKNGSFDHFELTHLPACPQLCTLALIGYGHRLVDSQPVTVASDPGTSATAALQDDLLIDGRWLTGQITTTRPLAPTGLHVELLGDTGKIVADSRRPGVTQPCATGACPARTVFGYRLGHIPADLTSGTVVVFLGTRRLASEKVRLPAGSVNGLAPALVVTPPT